MECIKIFNCEDLIGLKITHTHTPTPSPSNNLMTTCTNKYNHILFNEVSRDMRDGSNGIKLFL